MTYIDKMALDQILPGKPAMKGSKIMVEMIKITCSSFISDRCYIKGGDNCILRLYRMNARFYIVTAQK